MLYFNFVVDFGKQMEGQGKERAITAFHGIIPDAPSLSIDQFQVKQINTQLNSALDTEDIKSTQAQIESTKTIINLDLRNSSSYLYGGVLRSNSIMGISNNTDLVHFRCEVLNKAGRCIRRV